VIRGATPFVLLMKLLVALLVVFSEIALWLPRQMMTGPK
jgi:TRAP-type C4-dicarboxylate transport system permease large subunit